MLVNKSIPYVKGKQVVSLAKPLSSMSAEEKELLRSDLTKIKNTRIERKKPTGPMQYPGNPTKRPQMSREQYKEKSRADRVSRKATEAPKVEPEPKLEKNKFISGRLIANTTASLGVTGASAGVIHHRNVNKSDSTNAAVGAAGGAAAANAVYNAGGWAAKRGIERKRKNIETQATPSQRKEWNRIWNEHKKLHGVEQTSSKMSHADRQKFYESYPKELPASKATRLLALKNRKSVYAATIAAGTGIGGVMGAKSGAVSKGTNIREFPYLPENIREWDENIVRDRRNPISPLDLISSGRLMAQAQAASVGRSLSRRELRRKGKENAKYYEARAFMYSPVGRGTSMT